MSESLNRIYPGLVEVAGRAVKNAGYANTGRPQAVWFDAEDWHAGPVGGKAWNRRSRHAVLAGVYTRDSQIGDIVEDMLLASAEIGVPA